MRLLIENWRHFCLTEAEAPKFKEDPKDTVELVKALSTERDKERVDQVLQKIMADQDVAEVMKALEEMFQEITGDEEVEVDIEEGLDDLGRDVTGLALDVSAKAEEFLTNSTVGRFIAKAAPPVLGLALAAMMLQGGTITPGSMRTIAKLVSSSPTPESLGDALMDVGQEAMEAVLQERKKE